MDGALGKMESLASSEASTDAGMWPFFEVGLVRVGQVILRGEPTGLDESWSVPSL